jgi:hypothetical protein
MLDIVFHYVVHLSRQMHDVMQESFTSSPIRTPPPSVTIGSALQKGVVMSPVATPRMGAISSRLALLFVVAAVVAGGLVAAVAVAAPGEAEASYVSNARGRSVPVHGCPSSGCAVTNWLGNGTGVGMAWWTDCQWYAGNYVSPRWFFVYYWGNWAGWVHSSYVYNQIRVPFWRAC